jgi:hypothetical protein
MDKNLTAVEWLVEQFENHRATFFKLNDKEERVITLAGRDVIEQAKEMEKERIEKDYMSGYSNGGLDTCITPQQYYEHIYGGNK